VARSLSEQFRTPVSEVLARVEALESQRRKLEKDLADARRQLAMGGGGGSAAGGGVEEIGGVKLLARVMDGVGGKDLRPIAEEFKKQLPDGVIALVGTADGKAAVTVAVTGAAAQSLSAVDLAKAAVLALGGQGAGGRPDFAQGGAPEAARAEEGLAAIRALLQG
jgi:alanyl-tRNA synthetase